MFIPDQASRLELVIPALVSENLVSTTTMETVQQSFEEIEQWEEEKETLEPDDPELEKEILRRMILLSTAEALSPSFEKNTVRYAPGAIFAPGFYAATDDVTIGPFIRSFQAVFGRIPTYYGSLCLRCCIDDACIRANTELQRFSDKIPIDHISWCYRRDTVFILRTQNRPWYPVSNRYRQRQIETSQNSSNKIATDHLTILLEEA